MAATTLDFGSGLVYNNSNTSKATAVTVTADYESATLSASDYPSGVVTVNASARTARLATIP